MKIVESWPQVDGAVRYLLRDGHGKITVDVKDGEEMTGYTRHGYEGDEDKALKKAFKFLESKSLSLSPAMSPPPTSSSAVSYVCRDDYVGG